MDSTNSVSTYSTGSMDEATSLIVSLVLFALCMILFILIIVVTWKLYRKANKPGWASIIPFYNTIVLLEIIGRPIWWIILTFIPIVSLYVSFVIALDLAKSFGKSTGFGIANFFVPFVTYPILAFSKSTRYVGPIAEGLDTFGPAPDRVMTPQQTTPTGQPVPPPFTPPVQQPPEAPSDPTQPRPPQA